jgi:hypothetical protein
MKGDKGLPGVLKPGRYNAVNTPALWPNVGWTPTHFVEIHPTQAVATLVLGNAGPFKE